MPQREGLSLTLVGMEGASGGHGVARTPVGDFLRARRSQLQPEDVGLPTGGIRRVPGLRRDEVALLAGVSVDYLNRIEQGRERTPSMQILDAIGRALRLDEHGLAHLERLSRSGSAAPTVDPIVGGPLLDLLGAMTTVPAYVTDPSMTILAANPLTDALFCNFADRTNLLRMLFLDPHAQDFWCDWDAAAIGMVRNLRVNLAESPDYAPLSDVIGELTVRSPAFAALWARHEVRPRTLEDKAFRHPEVGELYLRFQSFRVDAAGGQRLYTYTPPAGSASEERLRRLRVRAP